MFRHENEVIYNVMAFIKTFVKILMLLQTDTHTHTGKFVV